MQFPLSFRDISLWLAFTAVVLLITTELVSPYYRKTNLLIRKNRLRNATLATSILFFITVAIRTIEMIYSR